jgi:hypothetical protein
MAQETLYILVKMVVGVGRLNTVHIRGVQSTDIEDLCFSINSVNVYFLN